MKYKKKIQEGIPLSKARKGHTTGGGAIGNSMEYTAFGDKEPELKSF